MITSSFRIRNEKSLEASLGREITMTSYPTCFLEKHALQIKCYYGCYYYQEVIVALLECVMTK